MTILFLVEINMIFGDLNPSTLFPAEQPEMPELPSICRLRVWRTPGKLSSGEILGAGFLRKNSDNDLINWRYPNFVLGIVLHGRGKYIDNQNREYSLNTGSTFVRIPNIEHTTVQDNDSDYLEFYLEIGPQLFQALNALQLLELTPPVQQIPLEKLADLSSDAWHLGWKLSNSPEDEFYSCVNDMIALLTKVRTLSASSYSGEKYRDLVDQACYQLGRDFQKDFSLQKFCRQHGVGYENFRKLFRQRIGMPPLNYRINCKMESAAVMLRNLNITIADIAGQLGYNNAYEFSAQFKKKFGMSPDAYRKNG